MLKSSVQLFAAALLVLGCISCRSTKSTLVQPASCSSLPGYAVAYEHAFSIHYGGEDSLDMVVHEEGAWIEQTEDGLYCGVALLRYADESIREYEGSRPLHVITKSAWESLRDDLVETFLPDVTLEGLRIDLHGADGVLYRSSEGAAVWSTINAVPENIRIEKVITAEDFSRALLGRIGRARAHFPEGERDVLIQVAANFEAHTPYLYVDPDKKVLLFIALSVDPEQGTFVHSAKTMTNLVLNGQVVTFIKAPFSTTGRLISQVTGTVGMMFNTKVDKPLGEIVPLYEGESMDLAAFEDDLDDMDMPKARMGSVELLIGGEPYFTRLSQSINAAEDEVQVRTYIFDNDDFSVRVADHLKSRSTNITVRVLMDQLGTEMAWKNAPMSPMDPGFQAPSSIVSHLRKDSEVKVRYATNPAFTSDHCKTTIIDRKKAYVGGMNIGREYRYEWHDMMAEVEGPIVATLLREFRKAWAWAGPGGDFALLGVRLRPIHKYDIPAGEHPLLIRPLFTRGQRADILKSQLAAIKASKKYIYVQNAYFADRSIVRELIRARNRGVDVRVILPSAGNHGVMNSNNKVIANLMHAHGIRVFLYPGMSHVKAAVYDGWACFGSANFDQLSLRINQECNLAYSDPQAVQEMLEQLFEPDFAACTEMTEAQTSTWHDHVAAMFANQL